MEEYGTIVDIKANFKDLEQLAQKTMQAKSKIDSIPGQLSYSLSGALSELSGVWTGELEALQQELEHDIRKYSEGLGETVQHIQKTAQGLKEMDMVMNAILMPSNIVLHGLSKFGFDVTSKRFISYQGRITPATGQLMARYKKGELYSYDTLFPEPKNVKVKDKNKYEAEILEAVKNHKMPSPDALRWGMGLAQDKHIKDPMKRQFIDTNLTNGQAASFAFDFIPFLGGAKAADEARTGKQYFTGKKLDTSDRAIAAASVLGGGFVKWTGKGAKAVLKGKPLSEQTHLKWNKKTGEVKRHTPDKPENYRDASNNKVQKQTPNQKKSRIIQENFVKVTSRTNIYDPKDIPSVRDGEFIRWFDDITLDELEIAWANPKVKRVISSRLRSPGKLHEWLMVARAPTFKRWGISAEQIQELRTPTKDVEFVNPPGKHHRTPGSKRAHNEILEIIDTSLDYDTFVRRLQVWSHYRYKGGAEGLPGSLKNKE